MLDTATPEDCGIDSIQLAAALEQLSRREQTLHGVLIIRRGHVIVDAWTRDNRSDRRHIINSCTKTILSALTGIAIEQGRFSVNDLVLDLLSDTPHNQADSRWRNITVHHLLSMSSGISWPQYGANNVSNAMGESDDWIHFILQRPMANEPGSIVNYSNGNSHLLSAILQQATRQTALEFGKEVLFTPLGITDLEWESDPQGRSIGSAALYLRPIDMAKIGLLYLNQGQWKGQQILPTQWIATSWRQHGKMPTRGGPADYGYYWWLYPDQGLCEAWGGAGQRIAVLHNCATIVVVTADKPEDTPRSESMSEFYALVERSVMSLGPLPPNLVGRERLTQAERLYAANGEA